jgi:hypothetical protein
VTLKSSSQRSGAAGNDTIKWIMAAVLGAVLLIGFIGVVFFVTATREASPAAREAEAATGETADETNDNKTPVVTASAEERRRAAEVPEAARRQIITMWDQMRATTDGTPVASKLGVLRGIEQREIKRMAALLSLDEDQVRAVIQVHMADQSQ